ncbi:glycosyltransferase involved in cell wall biosynthesis [Mucilaginibacter yixingensis]|uniref:Glycosyltransferase involved in cell wall biosynthesis n=1 Tax=Mucilaginibacter yixingensis TaxID=1295612 RepID=A0A2T5JFR4_9SPHI|nr:glycosyltransferase [Mucilaginibacter yixingensis]PTR01270.1 glycosyltransferase involved in cell wall biosynthesis [Mucilaginibacter yixingensis]
MRKSICIISQSHLSRNPRVLKECLALQQEGYQVTILTAIYSHDLLNEDKQLLKNSGVTCLFYSDLRKKNFRTFKDRLIRKTMVFLQQYFGVESTLSLGYGAKRLKKMSRQIQADLFICHQELPTCIGTWLLKKGKKTAFDLEDWYAEDLLPETQKKRPIHLLKAAEQYVLHNGTYCTTTSITLAKKLSVVYQSPQPAVLYNVFPKPNIPGGEKTFNTPLKLFWFSQTIGPGRGLEQFIALLHYINAPVELHLLGAADTRYQSLLTGAIPLQHSIHFHGLVPTQQLPGVIAQFDIGLALEMDEPPSRNYTITNKFFQYIQSGLPVIASATVGQLEAFESYTPGYMLEHGMSEADAPGLASWLNNADALQAARQRALQAAEFFNWENESKKLVALVENAIGK